MQSPNPMSAKAKTPPMQMLVRPSVMFVSMNNKQMLARAVQENRRQNPATNFLTSLS